MSPLVRTGALGGGRRRRSRTPWSEDTALVAGGDLQPQLWCHPDRRLHRRETQDDRDASAPERKMGIGMALLILLPDVRVLQSGQTVVSGGNQMQVEVRR